MVVTDIYGRYLRVETVDIGGEADSTMCVNTYIHTFQDSVLSEGETGLDDTGCQGCSDRFGLSGQEDRKSRVRLQRLP